MATYRNNIKNIYNDDILTVRAKKMTFVNNGVFSVAINGLVLLPNETLTEEVEGDNDIENEVQISFRDFLSEYNNDVRLSAMKSLQIRTLNKIS